MESKYHEIAHTEGLRSSDQFPSVAVCVCLDRPKIDAIDNADCFEPAFDPHFSPKLWNRFSCTTFQWAVVIKWTIEIFYK